MFLCVDSFFRHLLGGAALIAVSALSGHVSAQPTEVVVRPDLHAEELQLSNGLVLVTRVDPSQAVVAICAVFRAGSRDDSTDRPGLAAAVAQAAAPAGTSVQVTADFTRFCTEMPAADLAMGLGRWRAALGADPGGDAPPTLPGAPFFGAPAKLFQLAFEGHPYERALAPRIGDVGADEARAFRTAHYQPDAAAIGIVGAFDPARVNKLVVAAFGSDSGHAIARPPLPDPTRQTTERFGVVHVVGAPSPAALYGWVIPGAATGEHRALRLTAALVSETESSKGIEASVEGLAGPDLFEIRVTAAPRVSLGDGSSAVDAALTRLRSAGPAPDDLDRARRRVESDLVRAVGTGMTRAGWLAEQALGQPFPMPPDPLAATLAPFAAIGPAEVRSAVARYLTGAGRTIVEVAPPEPVSPASRPQAATAQEPAATHSPRLRATAHGPRHIALSSDRPRGDPHRATQRVIPRNSRRRYPTKVGATRLDSPR